MAAILRKIEEMHHVVRLRHSGDGKNKTCINRATRFWMEITSEPRDKDLELFKKALKDKLAAEQVYDDPVFVREGIYKTKGVEQEVDDGVFESNTDYGLLDRNKPFCGDEKGRSYFKVKQDEILKDIKEPRSSGSARKRKKLDASSAWDVSFSPNLLGDMSGNSVEVTKLHAELSEKIKQAEIAEDCKFIYENPFFQSCVEVLNQSKDQYISEAPQHIRDNLVEKWARRWAKGVSDKEDWAIVLEKCRKTVFHLFKKVCDLWNYKGLGNPTKPENVTVIEDFEARRMDRIMLITLVMNRANALYHMKPNEMESPRGLCWYSVYDEAAREVVEMPANPKGHSMNKRYLWVNEWLKAEPHVPLSTDVQKWLQIAFPERLAKLQTSDQVKEMELLQLRQQSLGTDEFYSIANPYG